MRAFRRRRRADAQKRRETGTPKETKDQRETLDRVMHEFKHGELKTAGGRKVSNPKQAVAIGLSEAGAARYDSYRLPQKRMSPERA